MSDNNVDLSEFLAGDSTGNSAGNVDRPVKKKKRSRKTPYSRSEDTELSGLRAEAKSLCSCYEQYRSVARYSKDRLRDWVESKKFDQDSAMRASLFDFVHKGYAFALDFVTKGGGHVRQQIESNTSLRTAIEQEGRDLVRFMNNKVKIATLTATGIVEGKMEQSTLKKNSLPFVEEVVVNEQQYPEQPEQQPDFGNQPTEQTVDMVVVPDNGGGECEEKEEEKEETDPTAVSSDHTGASPSLTPLRAEGFGQDGIDGEAPDE